MSEQTLKTWFKSRKEPKGKEHLGATMQHGPETQGETATCCHQSEKVRAEL